MRLTEPEQLPLLQKTLLAIAAERDGPKMKAAIDSAWKKRTANFSTLECILLDAAGSIPERVTHYTMLDNHHDAEAPARILVSPEIAYVLATGSAAVKLGPLRDTELSYHLLNRLFPVDPFLDQLNGEGNFSKVVKEKVAHTIKLKAFEEVAAASVDTILSTYQLEQVGNQYVLTRRPWQEMRHGEPGEQYFTATRQGDKLSPNFNLESLKETLGPKLTAGRGTMLA